MATNDFLTFGGDPAANVITQAQFAALVARLTGFQSGVAKSNELNKVWRQASIMAAVLAQFIVDRTGQNAVDDGTVTTLLANLKNAAAPLNGDVANLFNVATATQATHAARLSQAGFKNLYVYRRFSGVQQVSINGAAFTTTGATTFPLPVSGVAEFEIWGGGGGGGGTSGGAGAASGGGGGGGYIRGLVTGLSGAVAVTVGLGGAGGAATPTAGSSGGSSSLGAIATAAGGGGGQAQSGSGSAAPGTGGGVLAGTGVGISGQSGTSAYTVGSSGAYLEASGGGSFGTSPQQGNVTIVVNAGNPGLFPGGGATGSYGGSAGSAGADGMVIIRC